MASLRYHWWLLASVSVCAGCGSEATDTDPATSPPPAGCEPGEVAHPMGDCCAPGTTALDDGTCQPAGVPPELCAAGFEPDGEQGCVPILPASPCGPGQLAVPGQDTCGEVGHCGDGTWGDIPVEPNTEHVDGSYAGGNGDGSAERPWTTIQEGIDAAEAGAIVAVAAGTYPEDPTIMDKPLRLWGRCAAMVEVAGTGGEFCAVSIFDGAPASEIRGLAVTGPSVGICMSGSLDLAVDSVWVHDTGDIGFDVEGLYGPTSAVLSNSLIESSQIFGLFLAGAELTVERSVVRSTSPATSGPVANQYGCGVLLTADGPDPCILTMSDSVVEQNTMTALLILGASATLEGTVLRNTMPAVEGWGGEGIAALVDEISATPSHVALTGSYLAGNRGHEVFLSGGTLTATATVARDTLPDGYDDIGGRGVGVQADPLSAVPPAANISQCLLDNNGNAGIFGAGAELTVEATVVRRTQPDPDQTYGRGINLRPYPEIPFRAVLWLRGSVVTENRDVGIFVGGADAFVERSLVQDTYARPAGDFGDGMTLVSRSDALATAHLSDSRVARSARVGLANFGSTVTVERVHVDCCPIALNGEQEYPSGEANVALPFTFDDRGGNVCGCGTEEETCQVLSSGLVPPDPG